MKMFVALVLSLPLFIGCASLKEKAGCYLQEKGSAIATDVVASKLQCSNKFAIKADMDHLISGLGFCPAQTGVIADAVCPLLVGTVVDKLSSAAIPAEWGCSAANAKALVKDALASACRLIPVNQFSPKS